MLKSRVALVEKSLRRFELIDDQSCVSAMRFKVNKVWLCFKIPDPSAIFINIIFSMQNACIPGQRNATIMLTLYNYGVFT